MKQILELTEKEFMTGIAPASQVQDKGLWHRAFGITVFRDITLESDNVGLLQAGPAATDITGSIIQDVPFAWALDANDPDTAFGKLYIWGQDGWLYSINLSGDNPPVNLNAAQTPPLLGMTDGANGIFVMRHSTGDTNVWYFRKADIGKYGPVGNTPTFNNVEHEIEDTEDHPTHRFFDRVYFGNDRYIGQCEDDGSGGLTVVADALGFEPDDHVKTISDDGTYLVAGITKNTTANPNTRGRSRVIFWDTNQSSWQREWEIPDGTIFTIRRNGSYMEAVTSRGLFVFSFSTPPEQVLPYFNSLANVPNYPIPSHFAADVLGEALLWGGFNCVSSFGKITPAMPNAFFQPIAQFLENEATVTLVIANATHNTLFIGTDEGELHRIHFDAAGVEDVTAETIYIDLKRWYQIGRVTLGFASQLQENDEVRVTLVPDDGSGQSVGGTASFEDNGPIRNKEMYCTLEARKLKLQVNFVGGSVRIRNIQVWGDPIEAPTHTREVVGVPLS